MKDTTAPITARKEADFWAKVDKSGDCWEWLASKTPRGYGQFRARNSMTGAHRFAFELANGPIAPGLVIDHMCHNTLCVNPEHLRAVTNKQNMEHRAGAQADSKSGVRGVSWCSTSKSWRVDAKHHGKKIFGGRFKDIADAERAAVALRRALFTHSDKDRAA